MKIKKDALLKVRVEPAWKNELDNLARVQRKDTSDLVREAIDLYKMRFQQKVNAPAGQIF